MKPKSAYSLHNKHKGKTVYIVAPGPSMQEFPLDRLAGKVSVAINSTIEVWDGYTYWFYADKRITKIYRRELATKEDWTVVMPQHQAVRIAPTFKGKELYEFHYQIQLKPYLLKNRKRKKPITPYWFDPERIFIPGRASVASNATSFAYLMGARKVILIGVDFCWKDVYYTPGVVRNKGAALSSKTKVLASGLNWYRSALKRLWPDLKVFTVSKILSEHAPKIKCLSVEEALNG